MFKGGGFAQVEMILQEASHSPFQIPLIMFISAHIPLRALDADPDTRTQGPIFQ